jgi:hypothetical protein
MEPTVSEVSTIPFLKCKLPINALKLVHLQMKSVGVMKMTPVFGHFQENQSTETLVVSI